MSLAPSLAVPRPGFDPLPLYISLFCLLWSFAFVAGKIGVTDCPPLILFDGAVFARRRSDPRHIRIARRGMVTRLARCRCFRRARRRQQRAVSRARVYRAENRYPPASAA